jgi:hypothetical protein
MEGAAATKLRGAQGGAPSFAFCRWFLSSFLSDISHHRGSLRSSSGMVKKPGPVREKIIFLVFYFCLRKNNM